MLRRLTISNYLLIDGLDLPLGEGLSIITGETGSGKSILLGALGLATGERAESGIMRDPASRCVIELEVQLDPDRWQGWFQRAELPWESPCILRRQLEPNGRSRAFINDTPVRLEQLRELGAGILHVHSQHHTLLLNDRAFQLGLVDGFCGQHQAVEHYAGTYRQWRSVRERLDALREEEANARQEADYLAFQLNELDAAALQEGEITHLEQDLARAEHAEELLRTLQAVDDGVQGDGGLLAGLSSLEQALAKASRYDQRSTSLLERLRSVRIELQDIGHEASGAALEVDLDPAAVDRLNERLDSLNRLLQKHRCEDETALIALREDLRERLARIGGLGRDLGELEGEEERLRTNVSKQADGLSKARSKALAPLAKEVEQVLHDLGMPHAVFRFEHTTGEPGPRGIDRLRMLFSANKDRAPEPLDKVASGGELGRVMLALIGLAAGSLDLPTVVFDEVDTGVSGPVADRVGDLMRRMAGERQVIAITHLPQIAGKADTHLLVTKDQEAEVVHSRIRPIDGEERVRTLAAMLSGRRTTKAALENARELLKGG